MYEARSAEVNKHIPEVPQNNVLIFHITGFSLFLQGNARGIIIEGNVEDILI